MTNRLLKPLKQNSTRAFEAKTYHHYSKDESRSRHQIWQRAKNQFGWPEGSYGNGAIHLLSSVHICPSSYVSPSFHPTTVPFSSLS